MQTLISRSAGRGKSLQKMKCCGTGCARRRDTCWTWASPTIPAGSSPSKTAEPESKCWKPTGRWEGISLEGSGAGDKGNLVQASGRGELVVTFCTSSFPAESCWGFLGWMCLSSSSKAGSFPAADLGGWRNGNTTNPRVLSAEPRGCREPAALRARPGPVRRALLWWDGDGWVSMGWAQPTAPWTECVMPLHLL